MLRYFLAAIVSLLSAAPAVAAPLALASQDGRVVAQVALDAQNRPSYALSFRGQPVLTRAALGLAFERYQTLASGMAIESSSVRSGVDTYPLIGKASAVRDPYNELTVHFAESGGQRRKLDVIFRAYNSGFAFRYHIPGQPNLRQLRLTGEVTEYVFPADYACQAFNVGRYTSSHEGEFDPVRASQMRNHNLFDLPVVCETQAGGTAMAFAESDLRNYAGLYFSGRETGELGLQARLSPRPDDPRIAVGEWIGDQGLDTPWRVIMLGDGVADLLQNTLVTSLAAPAEGDFSWVKAGKYAWDWWNGPTLGGKPAPMTDATIRAYIDFASQSGLEYMLIDDGWYLNSGGGGTVLPGSNNLESIPEVNIPALVKYAAQRKVGLWLWVHWKNLDENMDQALPLYAKWGIKGIKADFMDRDDQPMVAYYQRLLKATAANHLLLDLHGAFPPRGLTRTFPHYLSQEGVFGAEYNKWTRRVTARHNVNLALTRNLLGPMDYTPGGFRNATPQTFTPEAQTPMVQTTRGQALAMYVVFESPFQGVSDSPDNYRGQSGFDFVQAVPASWDETRGISAALGDHVVVARRKGRDWYVGAMTNEQGRTVTVPLSFLSAGRWTAATWQDGSSPSEVVKANSTVRASDTIQLRLAPSGGAAVRISPAR
ncbi:MAG: glycoside hydrolase family 97 protein [Sphingomicrobium sp.]